MDDIEDYKLMMREFIFEPMDEKTFQKMQVATSIWFEVPLCDVWIAPNFKKSAVSVFCNRAGNIFCLQLHKYGESFEELLV